MASQPRLAHKYFVRSEFYWDNLIYFGMGPKADDKGQLGFVLPMGDKKLPGIAAEDIGKCAFGVFKRGASTIGQYIGVAGGPPEEACKRLTIDTVPEHAHAGIRRHAERLPFHSAARAIHR